MVNLASPSSSQPPLPSHRFSLTTSPTYATQTPPPSPTSESPTPTSIPLPGTSPRARALRRAARSALVDTYRRFVLTELTQRILPYAFQGKECDSAFSGADFTGK